MLSMTQRVAARELALPSNEAWSRSVVTQPGRTSSAARTPAVATTGTRAHEKAVTTGRCAREEAETAGRRAREEAWSRSVVTQPGRTSSAARTPAVATTG